jgi:hypothetical protein
MPRGLWVDLIKAKYLNEKDLFSAHVPRDRNFGTISRRSSGTSRWELGTMSGMGCVLISDWTGRQGKLPCSEQVAKRRGASDVGT